MPVVVIPVKTAIHSGITQTAGNPSCLILILKKKRQECGGIAGLIRYHPERNMGILPECLFENLFMCPLSAKDRIEFTKLCQTNRSIHLADPEIHAEKRVFFKSSILSDMIMAMISICLSLKINHPDPK